MNNRTLVVISDLHIGAGPLDDCDHELEGHLFSFLGELAARERQVELVINGDFLDFAQASPWKDKDFESESPLGIPLCYTEEQSKAKLEAIVAQHPSVFDGLRSLLRSKSEKRLTILPGNHDADFFWPGVRDLFTEVVCERDTTVRERLNFHLEQSYLPPNAPGVWIEHGNQYDPVNAFYVDEFDSTSGAGIGQRLHWSSARPPILLDRRGRQRLYECPGTRFMIKFMNQLDNDYPFVDNIKPFSKFLSTFGQSALTPGYGPITASLAVFAMMRYLVKVAVTNTTDLLGIEGKNGHAAPLLQSLLKSLSADQTRRFSSALRNSGYPLEGPLGLHLNDEVLAERLLTYLSENLDLVATLPQQHTEFYLDVSGTEGYLSLAKGFNIDETSELRRAAANIATDNDMRVVVMGHTHEPVNQSTGAGYFNTGSWTRYYDFRENKLQPWSILQKDSYKLFPFQLNFVEIDPSAANPARMLTYFERRA
jgi:UDP-2,3-diacylglucosamine pyrophosphatase LpxH